MAVARRRSHRRPSRGRGHRRRARGGRRRRRGAGARPGRLGRRDRSAHQHGDARAPRRRGAGSDRRRRRPALGAQSQQRDGVADRPAPLACCVRRGLATCPATWPAPAQEVWILTGCTRRRAGRAPAPLHRARRWGRHVGRWGAVARRGGSWPRPPGVPSSTGCGLASRGSTVCAAQHRAGSGARRPRPCLAPRARGLGRGSHNARRRDRRRRRRAVGARRRQRASAASTRRPGRGCRSAGRVRPGRRRGGRGLGLGGQPRRRLRLARRPAHERGQQGDLGRRRPARRRRGARRGVGEHERRRRREDRPPYRQGHGAGLRRQPLRRHRPRRRARGVTVRR